MINFSKIACIWANLNFYGACVIEESRRKQSYSTEYEGLYKVIYLSKGELSAHSLHRELAHIKREKEKVFINSENLSTLLNGKFCSVENLEFQPSLNDAMSLKYLIGNEQLNIVGDEKKLRMIEDEFNIYNPSETCTPLIFSLCMGLKELEPW
ncbi:MAG: hypothetical protein AAF208_06695 [Cyanobacteria bacterium P01_A01_bin.45]